jgi:hypothetical protein
MKQQDQQNSDLAALAEYLRKPLTHRASRWPFLGGVLALLSFPGIVIGLIFLMFGEVWLFLGSCLGLLVGLWVLFVRPARNHKVWLAEVPALLRLLQPPPAKEDIPALLNLMEAVWQHPDPEARPLAAALQDTLARILPFLPFEALIELTPRQRAFLGETLRERSARSGTIGIEWSIASLLVLATLAEPGIETTARALTIRDPNERVREAAFDYLKAVG